MIIYPFLAALSAIIPVFCLHSALSSPSLDYVTLSDFNYLNLTCLNSSTPLIFKSEHGYYRLANFVVSKDDSSVLLKDVALVPSKSSQSLMFSSPSFDTIVRIRLLCTNQSDLIPSVLSDAPENLTIDFSLSSSLVCPIQ